MILNINLLKLIILSIVLKKMYDFKKNPLSKMLKLWAPMFNNNKLYIFLFEHFMELIISIISFYYLQRHFLLNHKFYKLFYETKLKKKEKVFILIRSIILSIFLLFLDYTLDLYINNIFLKFTIFTIIVTIFIFIFNKYFFIGNIKIGILHSLTGTMSISEKALVDIELMAINEINNIGGINGYKIIPIIKDSKSNVKIFSKETKNLLLKDKVVSIFGCWTSSSRKKVKQVVEKYNGLLWYPLQYEGEECSPNIIYTGATPNQQIEIGVEWAKNNLASNFYLIGSDYVFPRIANKIIKALLKKIKGKIVGEKYIKLGGKNFKHIIKDILKQMPKGGVILNTINGDSNIAFFNEINKIKMNAPISQIYPIMSFSIGEIEVNKIGINKCSGHYACWNYFQSINTTINKNFIKNYKKTYNKNIINDPMECAYNMVYLCAKSISKSKIINTNEIKKNVVGLYMDTPSGGVRVHKNHHLSKKIRIGQINPKGQFDILFTTSGLLYPFPWNILTENKNYSCDHTNPNFGSKFLKKYQNIQDIRED